MDERDGARFRPAPTKERISPDLFERVDLRVGTIVAVEDVAGSRKLVRLRVDFGDRTRVVLAALKNERANPSGIAGLQALFVVNLPPRAMAGEVSEAMLVDLGYADGLLPALAVPERPVPNGCRAG
jgi:tRNA-binding protein